MSVGASRVSQQRDRWEQALRERPDRYGAEPSAAARASLTPLAAAAATDLLELGGGQGRDTLFFAAAGFEVTVLDFAAVAVETIAEKAASARLGAHVRVTEHDVFEPLPYGDAVFDGCYSHMLLCMSLDERELARLIGEIGRVLRPGGLCIYTARTTDDPDCGRGRSLGEGRYELDGFGVHFFGPHLIELLAADFEVLEVERFEEGALPRRLVRVTMRKPLPPDTVIGSS